MKGVDLTEKEQKEVDEAIDGMIEALDETLEQSAVSEVKNDG